MKKKTKGARGAVSLCLSQQIIHAELSQPARHHISYGLDDVHKGGLGQAACKPRGVRYNGQYNSHVPVHEGTASGCLRVFRRRLKCESVRAGEMFRGACSARDRCH